MSERMDVLRFEEYKTKEGETKIYPSKHATVTPMDNGDGFFLNIPDGVSLSGNWQILPRQERKSDAA